MKPKKGTELEVPAGSYKVRIKSVRLVGKPKRVRTIYELVGRRAHIILEYPTK